MVEPSLLTVTAGEPVAKLLSTGGDETGIVDGALNHITTPRTFYFVTPPGRSFLWTALAVLYTDAGSFDVTKMGNNLTLTTGIRVRYQDHVGIDVSDIQGSLRVKTNVDWGLLCGTDFEYTDFGIGDNAAVVRWKWPDPGCYCPVGYRISTTLVDDLSGLKSLRFMIHGRRLS